MRFWLLAAMITLAGCASDDPGPAPVTEDPAGEEEQSDEQPQTGPEVPEEPPGSEVPEEPVDQNVPPTASLGAVTDGLLVQFAINGSDDDGDVLSWHLDVDGDGVIDAEGEELPAVHEAELEAGEYTAWLIVSDGTANATSEATFLLEEAAADPAWEPVVLEGAVDFSCEHCWSGSLTPVHCIGLQADANGYDCRWFTLDASYIGHPFTAEADDDGDVLFQDTCGGNDIEVFENAGNEAGVVPAGAGCAVLWNYADQNVSASVKLTIL